VARCSVLGMAEASVLDTATAVVTDACLAIRALGATAFWKLQDTELLSLATCFEQTARLMYAAQVHLAGELDTRGTAERFGATSTAALLRNTVTISTADARARVRAARNVLPQDHTTRPEEAPPTLPLLRAALDAGLIGPEQTRTIVTTMTGLPGKVDAETRQLCQKLLVENGIITEPEPFAKFARLVALTCDPDGKLDDRDPAEKVELTLAARNPATGLTKLTGKLDDLGVELLSQAIDGLSKPRAAADGTPDRRSAATRRGQALEEVLRRYLDLGDAPNQGGERPHVTLTMSFEDLKNSVGAATLEHGGPISAAQARALACDASIVPVVMGSTSQVLDVGAASRSLPAAVRRAITLRDRGCSWPGCDRPAGWCDGHHVVHWVNDGPSSYDNACLLCPRHHAEIHRGHWQIRFAPDGIPEFIPPPWVDPLRKPRRNTWHSIAERLCT